MKRTIIIYALCILSASLFGQVELGGTTNYTEVEADGTLEFHGDATVFNDYVVPMSVAKPGNTAPSWASFIGNIDALEFLSNKNEEVLFTIQMPHDWDGSAIYPHIHWSPSADNNGSVVWGMEYSWVNYDSDTHLSFPSTTTIYAISEELSGNDHKHLITQFESITPTSSQNKISSLILVRFFRASNHQDDDFGSSVFALSFDIHYRGDTFGSRQEYIK